MRKAMLMVATLALTGLSIVSAKSYDITLSNSAKVGTVQLQPGEYKMTVDGSNVTFKNVNTNENFTTAAKIENSGKKHDATAVESDQQNGAARIKAIELGGSNETLQFGD